MATSGETTLLETCTGTARAKIISPQLLFQQLVAVNYPLATLDFCFRRIAPTTLAHRLEKMVVRQNVRGLSIA